jgi:glutamyl-tRNA reductase
VIPDTFFKQDRTDTGGRGGYPEGAACDVQEPRGLGYGGGILPVRRRCGARTRSRAMSLAVFSINHRTAPIEVRERFAVSLPAREALLRRLVQAGRAAEAVLLSTCNRTELYLYLPSARCPAVLLRVLQRYAGLSEEACARYVQRRYDRAAAEHLFRVSAGLDSLVLGEAEIQGQVRDAFCQAVAMSEVRVVGPVLSRLFQTALRAGGRVRSETGLGEGTASVASTAIDAARRTLGTLEGRSVLIVGAGEIGRLAVACLAKERTARVVIANRSAARAREIGHKVDAEVIEIGQIGAALADADVVISATSAPHTIITAGQLRAAAEHRPGERVVLDLAVPRDVEAEAATVPGVRLFTTDDLNHRIQHNRLQREALIPAAERIVTAAAEEFWAWHTSREVVPVIRAIRDKAEALRRAETDRALERLGHLSLEDRATIDALTRRLLAKILHTPTVRLRDGAAARHELVVDAARHLFDLDPDVEVLVGALVEEAASAA